MSIDARVTKEKENMRSKWSNSRNTQRPVYKCWTTKYRSWKNSIIPTSSSLKMSTKQPRTAISSRNIVHMEICLNIWPIMASCARRRPSLSSAKSSKPPSICSKWESSIEISSQPTSSSTPNHGNLETLGFRSIAVAKLKQDTTSALPCICQLSRWWEMFTRHKVIFFQLESFSMKWW